VSILAVDVGNTVTRYGLFDGACLVATWDIATRDSLTADEARLTLHGFFDALFAGQGLVALEAKTGGAEKDGPGLCGSPGPNDDGVAGNPGPYGGPGPYGTPGPNDGAADIPGPSDGIISCVVPSLLGVYVAALESAFGRRPLVVGPGLKTGLKMHYNDPAEVGSDRIADMIAARESYRCPLAIVDLGTATNITVLDANGVYIGGLIAPGLALSAKALSHAAARLPTVEIGLPASVIGKNTHDAMQAGFVLGETARIDGLIEMIWDEIGEEGEVIVTGMDAGAVAEVLAHDVHVDDTLTLRGLGLLYELNRKKG
jgi:type III pantothenate kinase